MAQRLLHVSVITKYFVGMRDRSKLAEYRLQNDYWRKRLVGREYDYVVVARGYPKRGDLGNRLVFPWRGYTELTLLHEHFGPDPVEVFAIDVSGDPVDPASVLG